MSPEVLGRLFEPFFTTKPEGTGLGLATARRFALLHGGWIAVESELGRGTTLTLFLPCAENKNTAEVPHRAAIS
jgi:signal transduction histidine kinase